MGVFDQPISDDDFPDILKHSEACDDGGNDPTCPAYYVMHHPDGDMHCITCHTLTNRPRYDPGCGHSYGCPGC